MKSILNIIKKAFLWSYPRNTWQWDVLCVLILFFIFMTPKSWFSGGKPHQVAGHQSGVFSTVLVAAELVDNEKDRGRLEQRVRVLTGRPDAQVIAVRQRQDPGGKTIGYEVDIR
jgi:hypothetical protein